MANIYDYIKWRGDLPMDVYPATDIDILIFSILMYGVFTDIVPEDKNSISIRETAEKYREMHPEQNGESYDLMDTPTFGPFLLYAMADTARYSELRLSGYRDVFNENESIQFAAMTLAMPGDKSCILFRGTDATIDGWREDFAISFTEVGAQKLAAEYLNEFAIPGRNYIVSGHSKGGNLAEYSVMVAGEDVQERITKVYSMDGPGICPEMREPKGYAVLKSKRVRIAPDFSVVGMLFRESMPDIIVKSVGNTILQHAAFTWQLEGTDFVTVPRLDDYAIEVNKVFNKWIENVSPEQRKIFTNEMFDAFKAGGAVTVADVSKGGAKGIRKIVRSLTRLDEEAKEVTVGLLTQAVFGVTDNVKKVNKKSIGDILLSTGVWYAAICMLIGVFFLGVPSIAMKLVGLVSFIEIAYFAIFRIVIMHITKQKNRVLFTILYSLAAVLAIGCIVDGRLLSISSSVIIGITFLIMCGIRLYTGIIRTREKQKWSFVLLVDAGLAFVFAVLNFVFMSASFYAVFLKVAGLYMVMMGMAELFRDYLNRELKVYTE